MEIPMKKFAFATSAFIALTMTSVTVQAKPLDLRNHSSVSPLVLIAASPEGQKAQSFINDMGEDAVSFLADKSLSKKQKAAKFRKLLKTSFDMKTIARFALGRYWKTATPAQQKEYLGLFENMIVNVYSSRFNDYQGEGFEVVSNRADGKRDFLVNSFIVPNSGSKVKVDWRVREKNGSYKIIDVIIEGVSMSLTQRSDFSSVIQRGGGKIDVLLDHLKK